MNYKYVIGFILSCMTISSVSASSSSSNSSLYRAAARATVGIRHLLKNNKDIDSTTISPLAMINDFPISLMQLIYGYSGIPQEVRHTLFPQWDPSPELAAYTYPYQYCCAYSPDHSHVVTVEDSKITPGKFTILVREVATNKVVFSRESDNNPGLPAETQHGVWYPFMNTNNFFWSKNGDLLAYRYPNDTVTIVAPLSGSNHIVATLNDVAGFTWSASDNVRFAIMNLHTNTSLAPQIIIYQTLAGRVESIQQFSIKELGDYKDFPKHILIFADLFWHPYTETISILAHLDWAGMYFDFSSQKGDEIKSNSWLTTYDIFSGKQLYFSTKLDDLTSFGEASLSPSGNSLAIPHTKGIFIYNPLTGKKLTDTNKADLYSVQSMAWINNKHLCISGTPDAKNHKVLIVNADTGHTLYPILNKEEENPCSFDVHYCSDLNQLLITEFGLVTAMPVIRTHYWKPLKTTAYHQKVTEDDIRTLCGCAETPRQPLPPRPATVSEPSSSSSSSATSTTPPTPRCMASAFEYPSTAAEARSPKDLK